MLAPVLFAALSAIAPGSATADVNGIEAFPRRGGGEEIDMAKAKGRNPSSGSWRSRQAQKMASFGLPFGMANGMVIGNGSRYYDG